MHLRGMLDDRLYSPPKKAVKRTHSPLDDGIEVHRSASKVALQCRLNEVEARCTKFKRMLATYQEQDVINPTNDFARHQRSKAKLYDKLNELAWAYRNKMEQEREEREGVARGHRRSEADGKELPVKDLWRWCKQMYRSWRHEQQPDLVDKLQRQVSEAREMTQRICRVLEVPDEFELRQVVMQMEKQRVAKSAKGTQ